MEAPPERLRVSVVAVPRAFLLAFEILPTVAQLPNRCWPSGDTAAPLARADIGRFNSFRFLLPQ